MTERLLGYDQQFTVNEYQNLNLEKSSIPKEEFSRRKNQTDKRTKHNLETMLGERFNLLVSKIEFTIENNLLINVEHDEPFLEVIKRGQKYREVNGSQEVKREKAEVEGFKKVQQLLTDPQYEDAKIIVISPKGKNNSMYQHNFFDVYEKQGDKIIMHRYASTSSWTEFHKGADIIDPFNSLSASPIDANFIANPQVTYMDENEILGNLNLDLEAMAEDEYQRLIDSITELKLNYVNALASGDFELAKKIFIATLNYSDEIVLKAKNYDSRSTLLTQNPIAIISAYGMIQPRTVLAGCGLQEIFANQSAGSFLSNLYPESVANFATCRQCNTKNNHFHCPQNKGGCGGQIPSGLGYTTCPHCGLTKEKTGSNC